MSYPYIIDSGPTERGWHYYQSFLACPMLFYWREVAEGHPGRVDDKPALARGTLVHIGLAHLYAGRYADENRLDRSPRMLEWYDAMRIAADRMGNNGTTMLPVATSMVNAYIQQHPHETFCIVAIERAVEIMFGSARFTARLDREVKELGGKVWIHDIKTTSRIGGSSLRQYMLHGQFLGAMYLGRHYYGDRFGGVIIDMISENGRCIREPVRPAPFALRNFPALIEETDRRILKAINTNGIDPNLWFTLACPDEKTCFGKYGACSCLDLCKWGR